MRRRLVMAAAFLAAMPLCAGAETVSVGGHDIWYHVYGKPAEGRSPVLLLHGGMMNTELTWSGLIPDLAQDRMVIGIDQQGHGHSADRDGPITLDSMRADTLGVLDALGLGKVHVVGFSLGGMLGFELATENPGRIASLTVISAPQDNDGFLPELVELNRNPAQTPSPELVERLPSPKDILGIRSSFQMQNPKGTGAIVPLMKKLRSLLASDWGQSDKDIAAIPAPVMIVIGDRDFVLPAHALHLRDLIADSWLAILPDTTHMEAPQHPALPEMLRNRFETAENP
ncbi:alpha/beta fold hydrolase [Paracoccus onubensis]|uniref:Alpha/beta fold hydrolase n=1 Tax=Paracoccus onubensis TaxID=1675788 RepID=A0A418SXQ7_9RHOB|nr:alpha/beta fold hydrolase [Paracoccus onubensis]RJE85749.1 alpha/beta fold hydrolase [Paracoccus onubensis]